jgi:uncharacterized protein YdeI (BOF family)
MKYSQYIIGVFLMGIILLNSSTVLAQDTPTSNSSTNLLNTATQSTLVNNDPKTQDEANILIDNYIKQSFADSYYIEKSSTGEIKLVVKNKYLFTKQQIDFATINYHIDKSFVFDGAQYNWRIKKGDKVVFEVSGIDKTVFFYTFPDSGTYQIEIAVNSQGIIKTGSISLEIFDKISLDYRPLNPAKGDTISVATELPISQYVIEWKIDGNTVEQNNNKITFTENKGYDKSYIIQAIARDRVTGYTRYYGINTIAIKQPAIRVSLVNNKNNTPIDYADDLKIDEGIQLLISSDVDNIGQNAKLSYTYRVNDEVQDGSGNSLSLDIDPNQAYKIDIVVKDINGDANATKSFIINKDKIPLSANIQSASKFGFLRNDRYMGLAVLSLAGLMILVMSRHSKLINKD